MKELVFAAGVTLYLAIASTFSEIVVMDMWFSTIYIDWCGIYFKGLGVFHSLLMVEASSHFHEPFWHLQWFFPAPQFLAISHHIILFFSIRIARNIKTKPYPLHIPNILAAHILHFTMELDLAVWVPCLPLQDLPGCALPIPNRIFELNRLWGLVKGYT